MLEGGREGILLTSALRLSGSHVLGRLDESINGNLFAPCLLPQRAFVYVALIPVQV